MARAKIETVQISDTDWMVVKKFKNGLVELKDHPGTMVGDFLRPLLKAFNN